MPRLTPMTTLDYVEQHSAQMTFNLFAHEAPRDRILVVAERELLVAGIHLTVAIIGSSHFLEVREGDEVLCEMLACPCPDLGSGTALEEIAAPDDWSCHRVAGPIDYQTHIYRGGMEPDDFWRESRLLSEPRANRLAYRFPGGGITALEWAPEGRRASVATYHTFPNELTIVRSRSLIGVGGPGGSR